MADYRISVDTSIDASKLDAFENRIKSLQNTDVKIRANIEVDEAALKNKIKSATSKLHLTADIQYTEKDLKKYASQVQKQVVAIQSKMSSKGVHSNELTTMENELDRIVGKYQSAKDKLAGNYSADTAKMVNDIEANLNGLYKRFEGRNIDLGIAEAAKQEVSEAEATFKRLNEVNNELYSRRKNLVKMDEGSLSYEQEIKSIRELEAEYTKLEGKLKSFDSSITDGMFNKLSNSTDKLKRDLASLEARDIDLGIAEEVKQETAQAEAQFKKLQSTIKEIQSIKLKQIGMDSSSEEYAALQRRLDDCVVSARELSNSLRGNMSNNMFDSLTQSGQKFNTQIDQAKAKVADLQRATAKTFVSNINNGSLISQLDDLLDRANRVGNRNINTDSIQRYRDELSSSDFVNMLSSNDEYASKYYERLTADVKSFRSEVTSAESDVKRLNRQIRSDNAKTNLNNQKQNLSLQIDSWLKTNSAAAAEFGDRLESIKTRIRECDSSGSLNNLKSEFQQVKLEAQIADKATMTFGDRLKNQIREYSSYIGIATVFMEGMQAARAMAQSVLEVDTAMTGLYRVTDLTSAQYDKLYSDMIASSKEYGMTLTDTINATADWVRAGYDADTALQLADITAMYQHISDLDYGEASENLLTAYNGFKDTFSEEFGGDVVASVNHIADAFNELDNKYSITSAGLGEGLARSASALQLAGNTFEEAAAMVGAAGEVTQDPTRAGTALRTLSLRIRGELYNTPPYNENYRLCYIA